MNKEKVQGTVDDAAGRAQRQVGEWTGSTENQAEGVARQIKGKAEKAVGAVKDAVRDVKKGAEDAHARHQPEHEHEDHGSVHHKP